MSDPLALIGSLKSLLVADCLASAEDATYFRALYKKKSSLPPQPTALSLPPVIIPSPPLPASPPPPPPSFSLFSLFSLIAPTFPLLRHIPDDERAKKIATRWKTKNQSAPISLLSFAETPEHRAFLEQIETAIDVYFGPARLVSAEAIEKEKQWESFLSAESLKLIVCCDYTLWQLGELMKYFKENGTNGARFLGKVPLLLLPDLTLYFKDPLLKCTLWKTICQTIRSL